MTLNDYVYVILTLLMYNIQNVINIKIAHYENFHGTIYPIT